MIIAHYGIVIKGADYRDFLWQREGYEGEKVLLSKEGKIDINRCYNKYPLPVMGSFLFDTMSFETNDRRGSGFFSIFFPYITFFSRGKNRKSREIF